MASSTHPTTQTFPVQIRAGLRATLEGDLVIPADATGIVLFAHGSGSSRFSSRNRFVAEELNDAGLLRSGGPVGRRAPRAAAGADFFRN